MAQSVVRFREDWILSREQHCPLGCHTDVMNVTDCVGRRCEKIQDPRAPPHFCVAVFASLSRLQTIL
jgi:hypothetical protein